MNNGIITHFTVLNQPFRVEHSISDDYFDLFSQRKYEMTVSTPFLYAYHGLAYHTRAQTRPDHSSPTRQPPAPPSGGAALDGNSNLPLQNAIGDPFFDAPAPLKLNLAKDPVRLWLVCSRVCVVREYFLDLFAGITSRHHILCHYDA
jgi:hypothetical protein